jgi:cytochrome c peroxidase
LLGIWGTIEQPPNRHRRAEGLTIAQRRGKAVFERTLPNDGSPLSPQRQCSFCHSGAYQTDHGQFAVSTTMWFDAFVPDVDLRDLFNADEFGELGSYLFIDAGMPAKVLDTPHLRNIVDSPPYLHNGAAATLEEIWTRFNMTDRHGPAADLTRQHLNDLIAYLKSL